MQESIVCKKDASKATLVMGCSSSFSSLATSKAALEDVLRGRIDQRQWSEVGQ